MEVPEGVTYIDTAAFGPCPALHKVMLPSTLTTLKAFAFQYDTLLDTIILNSAVPPATLGDSVFTYFAATLIVPCGAAEAYRQHEVWGLFQNIVEECNAIDEPGSADVPVRIYDMMGRAVLQTRTSALPAGPLPTGVYMVKVGDRPARKVVVIKQ